MKKEKKNNLKSSNNLGNRKIFADFERKDIEKSYNINTVDGTEAYFSNRYGWTLRKINK